MEVNGKQSTKKRLIDANVLLRHKRKMSVADFGGEFWDEAVLAAANLEWLQQPAE